MITPSWSKVSVGERESGSLGLYSSSLWLYSGSLGLYCIMSLIVYDIGSVDHFGYFWLKKIPKVGNFWNLKLPKDGSLWGQKLKVIGDLWLPLFCLFLIIPLSKAKYVVHEFLKKNGSHIAEAILYQMNSVIKHIALKINIS